MLDPVTLQPGRPKKRFTRRTTKDSSQRIRRRVQWGFFALNVWIGLQFLLWVRAHERPAVGYSVSRPPGVEGWLPIAGLMNTKYLLATGRMPAIHPAAMFLFIAFLAMCLLLKKSFCSWLCPVGTLSEYLWKAGQRIFGRNLHLPKWLDIPLRGVKYLLFGFFAFIIGTMSAEMLGDFMASPYGIVADVRMLNFFRYLGAGGAMVLIGLAVLSMLVQNFWCRYLCPYGALLGLASLLSPVRIRRDEGTCIDCGKCARQCPANLSVDTLVQIRSVECSACMACIAVCPAEDALQFALPARAADTAKERWRGRVLKPARVVIALALLFGGAVFYARITHHWRSDIPEEMYRQLIPEASRVHHPGV
ncbi:4Fe-4S binding protein [Silvibacterium sp.]|uniref:4Fe-4S binding protein n=1 Tax=Silvibacterium sp. TaxID=1964179 RepID=UPI0039E6FF6C